VGRRFDPDGAHPEFVLLHQMLDISCSPLA
jgi:hypothetical protein